MTKTARIEKSPGGGGYVILVGRVVQWVPGARDKAEGAVLARLGLTGAPAETAREALARCFRATRGRRAEIDVSIDVTEVR